VGGRSVAAAGWRLATRVEAPVVWIDDGGQALRANSVAQQLFGWSDGENAAASSPSGAARLGSLVNGEVIQLRTRRGKPLAVRVETVPASPLGCYVMLDPVDAEWQTAAERARRIHWLLELALDAALAVDALGRIREWNARCTQVFGYSAAEAYGQPFHELMHPVDTQGQTWTFFDNSCRSPAAVVGICFWSARRWSCKTGRGGSCLWRLSPMRWPHQIRWTKKKLLWSPTSAI